jgi:hypothetical protein
MAKHNIWDESPSLDELLDRIFAAFEEGVRSAKHPFHLGVFGTLSGRAPRMRTVVLRRFWRETPRLAFHTHAGSPKVTEIGENPSVAWVFYDREAGLQLRVAATASIHNSDELEHEQWDRTTTLGKRCYLGAPSGVEFPEATSGLPFDPDSIPDDLDVEEGRSNFVVISTRIDSIDCLELDVRGHRRSHFVFDDGGRASATWLTP